MTFAQTFLPEFEHEMGGTKSILALVPQSLLEWKAHEGLNTVGWVASHLVDTLSWAGAIVADTSFDVAPPDGPPHESPLMDQAADLVPSFEKNLEIAKQVISDASDESFGDDWSLLQGGQVLFTQPRGAVLRTFLLNHVIHHRAFLVAYLRINGIECPGLYG